MTPRFPAFDLTPAETASLEKTIVDLLGQGARLLHRPGPLLGRHDYAAALRLVRDASTYSGDLLAAVAAGAAEKAEDEDEDEEEEEKDDEREDKEEDKDEEETEQKRKKKKAMKEKPTRESAHPASCALLKGDALRGLGRLSEAAAAYREAAAAYNDGTPGSSSPRGDGSGDDGNGDKTHVDRAAARLAARHLADLEGRFVNGGRRRRAGGLWNAYDVAGARHRADDKEGRGGGREAGEARGREGPGRRAEYWDLEPALVVRSVTRHRPALMLVDWPAARAEAVPAIVVDVAAAIGNRTSRLKHTMTTTASTTMTKARPLTSSGRIGGGGGGSWLSSANPRAATAAAAPRSQEQPPRPLRRCKSTAHDLKALLQAQTGDRHGR